MRARHHCLQDHFSRKLARLDQVPHGKNVAQICLNQMSSGGETAWLPWKSNGKPRAPGFLGFL